MIAAGRILTKAMSTKVAEKNLVAVCQMTAQHDLEINFETCKGMIERAGNRNCKMIFFPECFDYVGRTKEESIELAMSDDCEYLERFRQLAKIHNIWLSLGGLHRKDPNGLPRNTHLIIDSDGQTRTKYDKLHLFDLDIPGKVRLLESEFSQGGKSMVLPVETPAGRVAFSICYDLRFPELSIWNRKKGADILTFPAAFTVPTGLAHWEVLLRARAIENQCYVIAAAQTGKHNDKRMSYGHAMIVDPWGAVVAQCSERVDIAFAEIDLGYISELREMQPVFSHRRSDLYSLHVNEIDSDNTSLYFSEITIAPECVFYRSSHCFAFVNLKPVLPGRDFGCTPDNLYENLEKHDKDPEKKPRTHDEMASEAEIYRQAIAEV